MRKTIEISQTALNFIKLLFIFPMLIVGCSGNPLEDTSDFPSGIEAKEAPMWAKRVAEGKLPSLTERLPENPLVAKTNFDGYERPGPYGGTWHRFHTHPDLGTWKMTAGYAPLIRWKFDASGLEPGLAETWEFNEDGSVLTLHLRKGVKWSDGHPYTSASFAFYYDLCLDERYKYSPPVWCKVNGIPMEVETPDDYTIVMKFAGPNWLVPLWLATGFWWCNQYNIPKHYMMQFHPDGNPEYVDFIRFEKENIPHQNPERPTLWPWRVTKYEKGGFRVELERNPYYYVVDELGRQLPYIDRVKTSLVPEPQVRVLKILAGEIDCQYRGMELRDLALYLKGQEKGNYKVRRWKSTAGAQPAILINWTAPDPELRKLIRDQRFRKALAYGIDRVKCNEIAWRGLLEPQAATVSQEGWHFADEDGQTLFEEWKRADADFDIDAGNQLLDEMGLTARDEDGYRLRPDGKRIEILMDVPSSNLNSQENDIGLIIQEGWEQLGLETLLYTPPGAELSLRRTLGKFTISMHGEAEMDLFTYPDWVFPTLPKYWHPKVGKWYETGGEKGEPATGPLKKLLDLYDEIKKEPNEKQRHQYVRDAVRIHIDEGPFHLGSAARSPSLLVVANHFHNVPNDGILGPVGNRHACNQLPRTVLAIQGDRPIITYIIRRCLIALPTLMAISIISFIIIQLPQGDYLDREIQRLEEEFGDSSSLAHVEELRERYGLNEPLWKRYFIWIGGFVRGNFGESFEYKREVHELIWDRIAFTLIISVGSLIFTYIVAIPLGVYSATHQYQWSDHFLTFLSFVGMSIPAFLLALSLMVFAFDIFGVPLFGLFSAYYEGAPWTWGKLNDLFKHLWIPVIVVGINGTASLMRIMRGNLLDVLGQPFVQTARAKGLKEIVVVSKHAVRIAINPLISILGMSLPGILSGSAIVSIVLGLPTVGPILLRSLLNEDIYLAGTLIMMLSLLLVIGNLIADIALAWVDPRIRYE